MDPEAQYIVTAVSEQCFLCAQTLERGSLYKKCTKVHLDNYEKYVQRHEVYKHIFNVRFMEYCSIELQTFATCSGCFDGVDELLFINNRIEELENQLGLLFESLTAEILQKRNKHSKAQKDSIELDPLDAIPKSELITPVLSDIVKAKVEIEDEGFYFHCPSPQESWEMDAQPAETEQILPISSPFPNNKASSQKNNDSSAADVDEDIYSIMSSREIRIVLKKLDIMDYTAGARSGLKIKIENLRASSEIDGDNSDWNADHEWADKYHSDFEINSKDNQKRKLRPKKAVKIVERKGWKRKRLHHFQCEICGDKTKPMSKYEFADHIRSHPKYKPYKCKFENCDVRFRWSYALKTHEKEHLGNVNGYNCDVCGKQYRGPYELRKHKQRVHVEEQEVCKICGNKYKLKQNLMVHVKRSHGISHLEYADRDSVTPFCCDICQQYYSSENMLATHNLRFHSESVDFFCDFCNTNVTPVRSLTYINTANKKLHTIGNIIKCSRKICRQGFNCTEKYNQHKLDHQIINRRPKKYKTKGTWKPKGKCSSSGTMSKRKYKVSKEKRPKIARRVMPRKRKSPSTEEKPKEKKARKMKSQSEEKPTEDRVPSEKKLKSGGENLLNGEENLFEDSSKSEEQKPEDSKLLSDCDDGGEMSDNNYLLSEEDRLEESDWLSDEEKSRKKKNTRRKRKYTQKNTNPNKEKSKRRRSEHKKVFKCEKCNEDFSGEVSLIKHNIKVHQQENSLLSFAEDQKKQLKCGTCGKGFRKQASLTRHVELHKKVKVSTSPEDKFKLLPCEHCGKVFRKKHLTQHIKIHNKIKRKLTPEEELEEQKRTVPCTMCEKKFKTERYMIDHMKKHFDVKMSVEEKLKISKFKCEECGKPLTTAANLRRHMRSAHNDDKPFLCTYSGCNRKYKDGVNLAKHIEGHQKVAQHECELCPKKFFRKDYLQLHFRRNHSTTSKQFKTWKNKSGPVSDVVPVSNNFSVGDVVPFTNNFPVSEDIPVNNTFPVTEDVPVSDIFQ